MLLVLLMFVLPHLLSLLGLYILWRSRYKAMPSLALMAINALLILLFALMAGLWAYSSVYFQFFYAAGFIFILVFILSIRVRNKEKRNSRSGGKMIFHFVLLLIFSLANFLVIKGYIFPKDEAIELAFPLRHGSYYVLQGGNSPITNIFHNSRRSQKYAYDIIKLNKWGNRGWGILPEEMKKYEIYGDTLYAPVAGKVVRAVDGFPDNQNPYVRPPNPLGNHVMIAFGAHKVLLAHFAPGEVFVAEGEIVSLMQPIGLTGSSGNSLEPHLHIQVIKGEWEPVPMKFNDRFLSINSVVRNSPQ